MKVTLHSTGEASCKGRRCDPLQRGQMLLVCFLVAPCQTGASSVSVQRATFITGS